MRMLFFTLFLVGCNTITVIPDFPPPPDTTPCEPLVQHPIDKKNQAAVAKTIVQNYTNNKLCIERVNAWNEWYINQKLNHEALRAKHQ